MTPRETIHHPMVSFRKCPKLGSFNTLTRCHSPPTLPSRVDGPKTQQPCHLHLLKKVQIPKVTQSPGKTRERENNKKNRSSPLAFAWLSPEGLAVGSAARRGCGRRRSLAPQRSAPAAAPRGKERLSVGGWG